MSSRILCTLNIGAIEMLDKFCQYYQEAQQNEAQNETHMH